MRIFIFHYHLNPGGVTRIIESQVAGFRSEFPEIELNVVTGYCENPDYYSSLNVNLIVNEKLNYFIDKDFNESELARLYTDLYNWTKSLLKPSDILHVHNMNLGKNPVLTLLFNRLLNDGFVVMNHAHDFAEDRPVNMQYMQKIIEHEFKKDLPSIMYPNNPNYLVGVLNNTDYKRIIEIGINKDRAFLFPNPVHIPIDEEPDKKANSVKIRETFNIKANKKIITYPVRVIRRKNIGELILLAVLFKDTCRFLVTMPPRNPVEIKYYKQWLEFCSTYEIPVIFEAGNKIAFIDLLSGSDYCITTSIKEGFGMTFLEPWLVETPVIGRNLPSVTTDIMNNGVLLTGLYNSILVPFSKEFIDFKDLSYDKQQQFIISVLRNAQLKQEILDKNEDLKQFPKIIETFEVLQNKRTITNNFSINSYAKRIFESYKTISG